ncbi:hypothetical protein GL300_19615 [Paracoccus litorisediminis]|uniref:Uncharacterized protein n=1 Tax=Paracoccus litorisediminis TaxID=2006130 RepID=A0A844HT80_9RHOB|nr:hypothetical protein [Paracoccus litorisediminis]
MIAALEVLSRPVLVDRSYLDDVVAILRDVVRYASREQVRLMPLIQAAEQFLTYRPLHPGYYGGLHDRACKEMNAWDRQRLADGWDAIRGRAA